MNLAKKRASAVGSMHIKDADGSLMYADGPDGAPDPSRPCLLFLHGPASPVFLAEKRKIEREILEAVGDARKNKNAAPPEILSAQRRVDFLCAITSGFQNVEMDTGDGPISSADLPRAIYSDPALGYIVEQADRFSQDWANFIPGSPTGSSSTSGSAPG